MVHNNQDDVVVLKRIRNGEADAFDVFYEKYWTFVYNCAFKRLKDREASKDISQEVFSQLWIQLQSGKNQEIDNVKGYLYVAVRNHVFKWMDKEQKLVSIADVLHMLENAYESADAQLLYEELLLTYNNFINELPAQQQLIFKLKYNDGFDSAEIAKQLNITDKTVRNQLGRALGKMRTKIGFWLIILHYYNLLS